MEILYTNLLKLQTKLFCCRLLYFSAQITENSLLAELRSYLLAAYIAPDFLAALTGLLLKNKGNAGHAIMEGRAINRRALLSNEITGYVHV